jgi:hypothetical protein
MIINQRISGIQDILTINKETDAFGKTYGGVGGLPFLSIYSRPSD